MKLNYDQARDAPTGAQRVSSIVSDGSKSVGGEAEAGAGDVPPINNANDNPLSPLYVVPSQFHEPMVGSEDGYLASVAQRRQAAAGEGLPLSITHPEVIPVRRLLTLDAVREFEDDFEPLYSAADHTLFIYPTAFERFHLRHVPLYPYSHIAYILWPSLFSSPAALLCVLFIH
jgi:hypothetical protein